MRPSIRRKMNHFHIHSKVLYKLGLLLVALVVYGALSACDESPVPSVTSEFTPTTRPVSRPAPTARSTLVPTSAPTPAPTATLAPTPVPTRKLATVPTRVAKSTPTATHAPVPTPKATPTPTRVATPTPTATRTPTSTSVPKLMPTPTQAPVPTKATARTPTPTAEPKPDPTSTPTFSVPATTPSAATGTATVEPTDVSGSDASHKDRAVLYNDVDITLGRAVLHLDGRVTLFYVAGDTHGKFDRPIVIDSAEITSSDGISWPTDGYGDLYYRAPLTLGWLTFPVSDASPGIFTVTVDSAKTGRSRITGQWQLRQLPGLAPRNVKRKNDVVNSGICVSSGNVAIGFHRQACPTEFYDMSPRRQRATPGATPVSPFPSPTPTSTPTGISIQINPTVATDEKTDNFLIFVLCTPWHLHLHILFDDTGKSEYTSNPPTTSARCVLP